MMNTDKEGLQDQLRKNNAVREEERDLAAEDMESIPSDHNADLESRGTSSKPASSSSKNTHYQLNTLMIMKIILEKSHP